MADQTSPTPMSPVTFGPSVFPMSPTAEGTQPASAEPGVSSSDVSNRDSFLIAPILFCRLLRLSVNEVVNRLILCRLVILVVFSVQSLVVSQQALRDALGNLWSYCYTAGSFAENFEFATVMFACW